LHGSVSTMRQLAMDSRPPLSAFRGARLRLETFMRRLVAVQNDITSRHAAPTAADCAEQAYLLARACDDEPTMSRLPRPSLWRDWWTGDFLPPPPQDADSAALPAEFADTPDRTRTARLARRPEVRPKREDEDDDPDAGLLMVQTSQPEEHAEDPFGMQRPV